MRVRDRMRVRARVRDTARVLGFVGQRGFGFGMN